MLKLGKFIALFLSLFIVFQALPVRAEQTATMSLNSAKTDYYLGDNIYVDIKIKPNGASLNVARAIMDFTGGNTLSIKDFNIGTALPYLSPGKELNNETNHINVGGFALSDSVSSDFILGTLIFQANQTGTATINFSADSHLISIDQQDVFDLANSQGITINVLEGPPPPVPGNRAPVFQAVPNKQINLGDSVNFHVQASDPDNDKINLTWNIPNDAGFNNITNNLPTVSGDFTWTPKDKGIYTLTFIATDNNKDSKSSTLTVSIGVSVLPPPQNHAPIFEKVTEKTVNLGDSLNFNVSATDPDDDNVILSLEPLENASLSSITEGITSTSRFSWTPKNSGIYYAVFNATDNNENNILSSSLSVRITVFGAECPPCDQQATCPIYQCEQQEIPVAKPLSDKPTPVINSPTHPNKDIWYSNNKPQFTWQPAKDAIGYVFNLDQNPISDPSYAYDLSQDLGFSFTGIPDGFWYFHLRVKYSDGWGPIANYQIKIDKTAPEFFKPSLEKYDLKDGSTQYKLYFSALDKYSGLAYYEMKIDDGVWQKVSSPYILNENDKKGQVLTLRAVDNAGNALESYVDLSNFTVLEKESANYVIEEKIVMPSEVEAPTIDHVILPQKIGKILVKEVLMVSGRAEPHSIITLHLSTEPETIFSTETNNDGIWLIYLNKNLDPGKYGLYANASLNGINSLPSEMVFFTLKEKFSPATVFVLPSWLLSVFVIIVFAALSAIFVLIRFVFKLKNKLKAKK